MQWLSKSTLNLLEVQGKYKDAFLSSLRVGAAPGFGLLGVSYPQEIERLQDLLPSSPGSWKLLPFTGDHVSSGRSSHSTHQGLVSGRERGDIPIHRGEVLTFVEGSSSFLVATTKFSMKQTLGAPPLPGTTSSCHSDKKPSSVWGLPRQRELGGVSWP